MQQSSQEISAPADKEGVQETIARLAREATIEINVQDEKYLAESREYLQPGTRVFVAHLPKQSWEDTVAVCRTVRDMGYDATPHVPVRLLDSEATLDNVLAAFAREKIQRLLLISGDYPEAAGPYSTVSQVLRSGLLQKHGLKKVSVAGHPEGHPKVDLAEVRRSEREKAALGGPDLEVTLVTQFFFEHEPFVEWVRELRAEGVRNDIYGGLAGPANLSTLFRFAMRCGAGPSIRALGARPTSLTKLIGERGPENVMRGLAEAHVAGTAEFTGVHFFCFGGFLRTCKWVHAVANGRFKLNASGGFDVA
ncbi:MAG: hypothetical protein DIU71_07555 [Proteobacteria bacterium]|nr:MAG: hypothetical protein DIU71_07555 [Pseudomonadota bacterium]